MHLHQYFFKIFEAHVSFPGTASGPSGRDRGFADAALAKHLQQYGILKLHPRFALAGSEVVDLAEEAPPVMY